jgi:hypothetical protein
MSAGWARLAAGAAALLRERACLALEALEKALVGPGPEKTPPLLLASAATPFKSYDLPPARVKPKTALYASTAGRWLKPRPAVICLNKKRALRQAELLTYCCIARRLCR